jgi:hypothetical protein
MDSDADGSEDALESYKFRRGPQLRNFELSCFRIENWLLILDRDRDRDRQRDRDREGAGLRRGLLAA